MRARREGYSARSVYKLEEIQHRHTVIHGGDRILDIGAAPGSWSQFARSIVGARGMVVAVDLSPLGDLDGMDNVRAIVGDIFDPGVIEEAASFGRYDAIISDAAPNTTGNRAVDTSRSAALVEHVFSLCPRLLKEGGSMVAKVFQGGDEQSLLGQVRACFHSGRLLKPRASRSESFEVFIVGTGYTSQI